MLMDRPSRQILACLHRFGCSDAPEDWFLCRGGRTNHVWQEPHAKLVLKVYRTGEDNPLFPNDPQREARALIALHGQGIAPEFVAKGHLAGRDWLAYRRCDGAMLRNESALAARTLRRLHELPPWPGLPKSPGGSLHLDRQIAKMRKTLKPALACDLPESAPGPFVSPWPMPVPLHGDPVPGNMIVGAAGLRLIDWQCPTFGDPVFDLAIFLSPAMQWLYGRNRMDVLASQKFWQAYGSDAIEQRYKELQPRLHLWMAVYCIWRYQRGAEDYEIAARLELDALSEIRKPF